MLNEKKENLHASSKLFFFISYFARMATKPLELFMQIESASGILLFISATCAVVVANSPWAHRWSDFWHHKREFQLGALEFGANLEWFINDVWMVFFFFVVGLEIKREIHHGELSQWRRAALPFFSALGGMVAPAVIYLAVAGKTPARSGWGIPMATDIAFALGIFTLLGRRVPPALKVLLLALAVIDDLGAIVVIALFYSNNLSVASLLFSLAGIVVILFMQRVKVEKKWAYMLPAFFVWFGAYRAGIHPTIAGVAVGLLTPLKRSKTAVPKKLEPAEPSDTKQLVAPLELPFTSDGQSLSESKLGEEELLKNNPSVLVQNAHISPGEELIRVLHPWVAFCIMPVFALANSGVALSNLPSDKTASGVGLGVFIGLMIGKPLGVYSASFLAIKLRFAAVPAGISFRHIILLGITAAIGFTMSLFITGLAFDRGEFLSAAKLGVLAASATASLLSWFIGRSFLEIHEQQRSVAENADEAERSTEM